MLEMRLARIPAAFVCTALLARAACAAEARTVPFGKLPDGTAIEAVELSNAHGVRVRVLTLGATIQSLVMPDRDGRPGDIVLGYATAPEYLAGTQYFGATVGRYANRIAGARFTLDGRTYVLAANEHGNQLHGGPRGFNKVVWRLGAVQSGPTAAAVLSHVSPDGDQGYPGTLRVSARFSLDEHELRVEYRAQTDKPTVVNITNHSYFNLATESGGSILDARLTIHASRYMPIDAGLIPTGELRAVAGTAFDFRNPTPIGLHIRDGRDEQIVLAHGYDHNFVLDSASGTLRPIARLEDPRSGRVLDLLATAPGLQFYSGNFLDGSVVGKSGHTYRQSDGVCLEPQVFPNSPNEPRFPSARLDPGGEYRNIIAYRLSTEGR